LTGTVEKAWIPADWSSSKETNGYYQPDLPQRNLIQNRLLMFNGGGTGHDIPMGMVKGYEYFVPPGSPGAFLLVKVGLAYMNSRIPIEGGEY